MRADLTLEDLTVVLSMIDGAFAAARDPEAREAIGNRAFRIAMDGLRLRA